MERCPWAKTDLYVKYHDAEWGVPVHDDRLLFEFLILEGAQAGLSWETILKKRANYREAFNHFEPAVVAESAVVPVVADAAPEPVQAAPVVGAGVPALAPALASVVAALAVAPAAR